MSTLDDFFGDGSADNIPECSFCGKAEGELIVSIQDAYGPTHWNHAACKAADDAKKGTPIVPTWDEAMDSEQASQQEFTCFKCRNLTIGTPNEITISPVEIHYYCDACYRSCK